MELILQPVQRHTLGIQEKTMPLLQQQPQIVSCARKLQMRPLLVQRKVKPFEVVMSA